MEEKVIGSVYAHINNGGVTYSVVDNGRGPCIKIKSSSFGNNNLTYEVNVEVDVLSKLAEMFKSASEMEYNEKFSCEAKLVKGYPVNCLKDSGGEIHNLEELEIGGGNFSMEKAYQLAAQAWCGPETKKLVLDHNLAKEFANILFREVNRLENSKSKKASN